jgi:hypothetical protein
MGGGAPPIPPRRMERRAGAARRSAPPRGMPPASTQAPRHAIPLPAGLLSSQSTFQAVPREPSDAARIDDAAVDGPAAPRMPPASDAAPQMLPLRCRRRCREPSYLLPASPTIRRPSWRDGRPRGRPLLLEALGAVARPGVPAPLFRRQERRRALDGSDRAKSHPSFSEWEDVTGDGGARSVALRPPSSCRVAGPSRAVRRGRPSDLPRRSLRPGCACILGDG